MVAFEDLAPSLFAEQGRVPLEEVLEQGMRDGDSRKVAVEMAKVAGQYFEMSPKAISEVPHAERQKRVHLKALSVNHDSTVSAFDLKALQGSLSEEMGALGDALRREIKVDGSFRKNLAAAKKANEIERTGDLVDLGGFLRDLQPSISKKSIGLHKALTSTLRSLDQTILHKRTSAGSPLSGLSVHIKLGTAKNLKSKVPSAWQDFVKEAF